MDPVLLDLDAPSHRPEREDRSYLVSQPPWTGPCLIREPGIAGFTPAILWSGQLVADDLADVPEDVTTHLDLTAPEAEALITRQIARWAVENVNPAPRWVTPPPASGWEQVLGTPTVALWTLPSKAEPLAALLQSHRWRLYLDIGVHQGWIVVGNSSVELLQDAVRPGTTTLWAYLETLTEAEAATEAARLKGLAVFAGAVL